MKAPYIVTNIWTVGLEADGVQNSFMSRDDYGNDKREIK